jgi:FixJ family two-component response regulator
MTKIGLVDDDASIRTAMSRLLRSHGYECVAYESAEAALADPTLSQVSCLLIDIELYGMNGFEFRDRLRDQGALVPHIFVTAHSEDDFPDWRARMGDSPCLTKPVGEGVLISAIKMLSPASRTLPRP